MGGFAAVEAGEGSDGVAGFLFGQAEVVEGLEIEPELGGGAEEVGEAEGGVAGDGTGAIQDLGDAVGGDFEFAGEFGGAHAEGGEFFGQVLAGMNWSRCHRISPFYVPGA